MDVHRIEVVNEDQPAWSENPHRVFQVNHDLPLGVIGVDEDQVDWAFEALEELVRGLIVVLELTFPVSVSYVRFADTNRNVNTVSNPFNVMTTVKAKFKI